MLQSSLFIFINCETRISQVNDPNDLLVVTAGLPFGTPGAANIIRVLPAAGPQCWDGVCHVD